MLHDFWNRSRRCVYQKSCDMLSRRHVVCEVKITCIWFVGQRLQYDGVEQTAGWRRFYEIDIRSHIMLKNVAKFAKIEYICHWLYMIVTVFHAIDWRQATMSDTYEWYMCILEGRHNAIKGEYYGSNVYIWSVSAILFSFSILILIQFISANIKHRIQCNKYLYNSYVNFKIRFKKK